MALNLSGTRRWGPIKNHIYNRHKISVNFAAKKCGYVPAYRYVCKDKPLTDVLHSPSHSDMSNILSPVTKNTMKNFQSNVRKRRSSPTNAEKTPHQKNEKNVKKKRLANCDVLGFVTKSNSRKKLCKLHCKGVKMAKKISKALF